MNTSSPGRAALTGVEVFIQAELDQRPDAFRARLEIDGDVDDVVQLVELPGHAAVEVAEHGAVPYVRLALSVQEECVVYCLAKKIFK